MGTLLAFMKNKKTLVPIVLIGFLMITTMGTILESIRLNQVSLKLLKQIARNGDVAEIINYSEWDFSGTRKCHFQWLNAIASNYLGYINRPKFMNVLTCMPQGVEMMQKIFPFDEPLAEAAYNLYPNEILTNYWLLDSVEKSETTKAISLAKEIVNRFPSDAVIRRRLGTLLWSNKQYEEGLQAYLKACEIDDVASNGCYYVASSYRSLGDPLKAIQFFRKSYWPPSWQEADKLEAQIATGEIVP